jgi:hypothetical protein
MTATGLTADRIETMTTGEITKRLRGLRSLIRLRKEKHVSTHQDELDFCYLSREQEDRSRRNAAGFLHEV